MEKNDWKKNWPGRQDIKQPYRITFSLNSLQGVYVLKISTLIEQPRVPALRIDVNGHSGMFYLHPQLSYYPGDFTFAFDPHESESTLKIDIPPSFLKQGENAVTITCLDDPPAQAGEERFSGITYDALSLEQRSKAHRNMRPPKYRLRRSPLFSIARV